MKQTQTSTFIAANRAAKTVIHCGGCHESATGRAILALIIKIPPIYIKEYL